MTWQLLRDTAISFQRKQFLRTELIRCIKSDSELALTRPELLALALELESLISSD